MHSLVLMSGIPLMLSLLINNLYNVVDSIFISYVSEKALTALSLAGPVQIFMGALGFANAVGIHATISRALGRKDEKEVAEYASAGIWIGAAFWVLLALLSGVILKPYFLSQSGGDMEIAQYGITYTRICMLGSIGVMGQWVFDRFTIASGKSVLFLITLSSGAITNIILDPIFIFALKMDVAGAAVATVLGQCVGAGVGIIVNKKLNREIPIRFTLKPEFGRVLEILKIGVPSGISQCLMSVMGMYVNSVLISFSSTTVAVYGICNRYSRLRPCLCTESITVWCPSSRIITARGICSALTGRSNGH